MRLQGNNTFLRALEPHDVECLFHWENDPSNWLVSGTKTPFSKQQISQYIKGIRDIYIDKQLRLMICTEQEPIGTIDLYDFNPANMRAGIGILIGKEKYRGKGYAKDALQTLIKYAFEILILHQLHVCIPAYNVKSQELFEKNGFVQSGTRTEWLKTKDGWEDEFIYQLLRS